MILEISDINEKIIEKFDQFYLFLNKSYLFFVIFLLFYNSILFLIKYLNILIFDVSIIFLYEDNKLKILYRNAVKNKKFIIS